MEKNESMKKRCLVVLPEGKFADEDDCCGDCDHGIEYKDGGFFGTDKVLCGLDGKWHKSSDVCRNHL